MSNHNGVTWKERFEYDMQYVDNWSLLLGAKILLNTISMVFKREGIPEKGRATMTEFTGPSGKQSLDKDVSVSTGS